MEKKNGTLLNVDNDMMKQEHDYREDYIFKLLEEIQIIINKHLLNNHLQNKQQHNDNESENNTNNTPEVALFHVSIFLYEKRYNRFILRASTQADYRLGTMEIREVESLLSQLKKKPNNFVDIMTNEKPGITVYGVLTGEITIVDDVNSEIGVAIYHSKEHNPIQCEFDSNDLKGVYVIPLKTKNPNFGGIKAISNYNISDNEQALNTIKSDVEYTFGAIRIATSKKCDKIEIYECFSKEWIHDKETNIQNTFALSELIEIGSAGMDVESLCQRATGIISHALGAKGCSIFLVDTHRNLKGEELKLQINKPLGRKFDHDNKELIKLKRNFLETTLIYRCHGTTGLSKPNEWGHYQTIGDHTKEYYEYKLQYEIQNRKGCPLNIPMTTGVIRARQCAFIDNIRDKQSIEAQFSEEYKIGRQPGHGKACEHFGHQDRYYKSESLMYLPMFYREPMSRSTEVLGVIRVLRPKRGDNVTPGLNLMDIKDFEGKITYDNDTGYITLIDQFTVIDRDDLKEKLTKEEDKRTLENLFIGLEEKRRYGEPDFHFGIFSDRDKHFFVSYVEKLAQLIAHGQLYELLKALPKLTRLEDVYDQIIWAIPRIIGGSDCAILRFDEETKSLWIVREWRTVELELDIDMFKEIWFEDMRQPNDNKPIKITTGVYLNYPELEGNEKGIKEYDLSAVWNKSDKGLIAEESKQIGYTGWVALRKPEDGLMFNSKEGLRAKFKEETSQSEAPHHRSNIDNKEDGERFNGPSKEKYYESIAIPDETSRFLGFPIFEFPKDSKDSVRRGRESDPKKLFGVIRICKGAEHSPFTEDDLRVLKQIVNQVELVVGSFLKDDEEKKRRQDEFLVYFPRFLHKAFTHPTLKDLASYCQNTIDIERAILIQIRRLWDNYGRLWDVDSKQITTIIEQFAVLDDKVLQTIMPHYRDHFIHQAIVFVIGFEIIRQLKEQEICKEINFHDLCRKAYEWDLSDDSLVESSWFLAANFHDVGYPVEHVDIWIRKIIEKFFRDVDNQINQIDVFRLIQSVQPLREAIDDLVTFHVKLTNDQQGAVHNLFCELLINYKDHAVVSAAILQSMKRMHGFNSEYLKPVSSAISIHNKMIKLRHINEIHFLKHPLAFLLAYCDLLHEWRRMKFERVSGRPNKTKLENLWFGVFKNRCELMDMDRREGKEECALPQELKNGLEKLLKSFNLSQDTLIVFSNLVISDPDTYENKRKEIENNLRILYSNNPIFIVRMNGDHIFHSFRK